MASVDFMSQAGGRAISAAHDWLAATGDTRASERASGNNYNYYLPYPGKWQLSGARRVPLSFGRERSGAERAEVAGRDPYWTTMQVASRKRANELNLGADA